MLLKKLKNTKTNELGLFQSIKMAALHKSLLLLRKVGINTRVKSQVRIKDYRFPVRLRSGSTDYDCFHQIFVQKDYLHGLDRIHPPKILIDAGANAGYSSVFFLNRFPELRVIALEPDPNNFKMASENLAPFKERVKLINAGLWPSDAFLEIVQGDYGQGGEWAIQVRETLKESPIKAYSLNSIIEENKLKEIDLLKIDIEGSEKAVFHKNTEWLKFVKNIIIELHDAECERIFFEALKNYNFEMMKFREHTLCLNIRLKNLD